VNYIIAFDVEGPIASPSFDFTWISLEQTTKQFHEKIKLFDEYDDLRWERERNKKIKHKHSTGTTPLISLLATACEGFTDLKLKKIAREKLKLSRGIEELLKWLINERQIIPYLITSSYPAISLLLGRKFKIPSSHIYCAGNQLNRKELLKFDSNPNLNLELHQRSPLKLWRKNQSEAIEFLNKYLENCIELRNLYLYIQEKKNKNNKNKNKNKFLLKQQQKIFREIKDIELKTSLINLILKQKGVMGAHNKKKVLKKLSPDPKYAIYIGDGIVDADSLEYANHGIALNCIDKFALHSCKLNIATANEALLIPILEEILKGKFKLKIKQNQLSNELYIFNQKDIKAKYEEVKKINSYFRATL
jgi:predicted HAD superfamily phosphohydrolase